MAFGTLQRQFDPVILDPMKTKLFLFGTIICIAVVIFALISTLYVGAMIWTIDAILLGFNYYVAREQSNE